MDAGCSLTGWSAVTSALANSTLAAVLAGFMIGGVVMLLSTGTLANSKGYVQALSLLFTAFVALGLDSYLFGLVTGDSTGIIGKVSACRRTWTEAMFAAGLLGVGTVAIIAGFVFLFAVYFGNMPHGDLGSSLDSLIMLCTLVRAGVGLVVIATLYMTARSYLLAIFMGKMPIWAKAFIYGYLVIGVIAVVSFTIAIFAPLRNRERDLSPIVQRLRSDNDEQFIRTLKFAIYYSVTYSVLTVIFAVVAASSRISFWDPSRLDVKAVVLATLIWMSLVPLTPLLLLTGRVVPDFGPKVVLPIGTNHDELS